MQTGASLVPCYGFGEVSCCHSKLSPGLAPVGVLHCSRGLQRHLEALHGPLSPAASLPVAAIIALARELHFCLEFLHQFLQLSFNFPTITPLPPISVLQTDVYDTLNRLCGFDSPIRRFQRKMEKAWGECARPPHLLPACNLFRQHSFHKKTITRSCII